MTLTCSLCGEIIHSRVSPANIESSPLAAMDKEAAILNQGALVLRHMATRHMAHFDAINGAAMSYLINLCLRLMTASDQAALEAARANLRQFSLATLTEPLNFKIHHQPPISTIS